MIELNCACGAALQVDELYAGGHVVCHACGSSVLVPNDAGAEEHFRFQCPHCHARVVARKTSAGKKSQCPACEKLYVIPDPPPLFASEPTKDRRIELATDDLALRFGLPFEVGKRGPAAAVPPQPRFLHSPSAPRDNVEPIDLPLPADLRRQGSGFESTVLEIPIESPIENLVEPPKTDPDLDQSADPPTAPNGHFADAAITADWTPVVPTPDEKPPASESESSRAPTAAAIQSMDHSEKPASVGELQVVSGSCSGQRIRLDFHHFLVGAECDCNLRPTGSPVSRHHCVFKKDEYSLRIRDLGSADGTFVNGRRIYTEAILKPGDEVKIADLRFHIVLPCAPQVIHSVAESSPSISDFVIL